MTRTTREVLDKLSPFTPEHFENYYGMYAPEIADALNSYGKMQDEIAASREARLAAARETIRELCEHLSETVQWITWKQRHLTSEKDREFCATVELLKERIYDALAKARGERT